MFSTITPSAASVNPRSRRGDGLGVAASTSEALVLLDVHVRAHLADHVVAGPSHLPERLVAVREGEELVPLGLGGHVPTGMVEEGVGRGLPDRPQMSVFDGPQLDAVRERQGDGLGEVDPRHRQLVPDEVHRPGGEDVGPPEGSIRCAVRRQHRLAHDHVPREPVPGRQCVRTGLQPVGETVEHNHVLRMSPAEQLVRSLVIERVEPGNAAVGDDLATDVDHRDVRGRVAVLQLGVGGVHRDDGANLVVSAGDARFVAHARHAGVIGRAGVVTGDVAGGQGDVHGAHRTPRRSTGSSDIEPCASGRVACRRPESAR